MDEYALVEKIVLNLGNSTPYLLVVFMFFRWMWPNLYELFKLYLETRHLNPSKPDPVGDVVDVLAAKVGTPSQFVFYVVDDVTARNQAAGLIGDVGGMVRDVKTLLKDARAQLVKQPPVSPQDCAESRDLSISEAVKG